jgi:hypothetical protein
MVEQGTKSNTPKGANIRRRILMAAIALAIVTASGVAAFAVMYSSNTEKNKPSSPLDAEADKKAKEKTADKMKAEAEELIAKITEQGSGTASDEMTKEVISKYKEASAQYEEAGNMHESLQAKANADAFESRLKIESAYNKKLEAEHAKQKADYEAAKAAMSAAN